MQFVRAPVAQGIEHRFPKPCAQVRILPGAPDNRRSVRLQIGLCPKSCANLSAEVSVGGGHGI